MGPDAALQHKNDYPLPAQAFLTLRAIRLGYTSGVRNWR